MKTQEWDVAPICWVTCRSPRSRFAPTCLNIDRHWQMLSSYVTAFRFLRVPVDITAWHMTRHKPIDRHRIPGFRARHVLMPSARLPNTVTLLPCHDAHTHPNYHTVRLPDPYKPARACRPLNTVCGVVQIQGPAPIPETAQQPAQQQRSENGVHVAYQCGA